MASPLLLVVIYLAFISLGLPDSVLGVAWPIAHREFHQSLSAIALIILPQTAFSALSGFMSGTILRRLSAGKIVAASGLLTGSALLSYSMADSLGWMVLMAVPLGLGAGAVDSALNDYVAEHYTSRQMNWLHGCWGIGATISPLIVGTAISTGFGWRFGYLTIGTIQIILGALFILSLSLWKATARVSEKDCGHSKIQPQPATWITWLAPALYFIYTAAEAGTGLWLASILIEQRGFSPAEGGFWVSSFYGALTTGRFAIGTISNRLGNREIVRYSLATALFGALLFTLFPGFWQLALPGVVLLGLGCAPIYPALMHETPRRFDAETTKIVIGRQVACACIGATCLPALLGALASVSGVSIIMPCIIFSLILLLGLSELLNQLT